MFIVAIGHTYTPRRSDHEVVGHFFTNFTAMPFPRRYFFVKSQIMHVNLAFARLQTTVR